VHAQSQGAATSVKLYTQAVSACKLKGAVNMDAALKIYAYMQYNNITPDKKFFSALIATAGAAGAGVHSHTMLLLTLRLPPSAHCVCVCVCACVCACLCVLCVCVCVRTRNCMGGRCKVWACSSRGQARVQLQLLCLHAPLPGQPRCKPSHTAMIGRVPAQHTHTHQHTHTCMHARTQTRAHRAPGPGV